MEGFVYNANKDRHSLFFWQTSVGSWERVSPFSCPLSNPQTDVAPGGLKLFDRTFWTSRSPTWGLHVRASQGSPPFRSVTSSPHTNCWAETNSPFGNNGFVVWRGVSYCGPFTQRFQVVGGKAQVSQHVATLICRNCFIWRVRLVAPCANGLALLSERAPALHGSKMYKGYPGGAVPATAWVQGRVYVYIPRSLFGPYFPSEPTNMSWALCFLKLRRNSDLGSSHNQSG